MAGRWLWRRREQERYRGTLLVIVRAWREHVDGRRAGAGLVRGGVSAGGVRAGGSPAGGVCAGGVAPGDVAPGGLAAGGCCVPWPHHRRGAARG